jgi:signal transduction histidine kinase/CheY-like chemotaxis protein
LTITAIKVDDQTILNQSLNILYAEDNQGDVIIIKVLLQETGVGFNLNHVATLKETLLRTAEQDYDIILLDLHLPDSVGLETLKKIQVSNVMSPVIVMTGLDDEDVALEAIREGAQDYLVKTRLTSEILLRCIKYSIERKKIQDLLKNKARQFNLLSSTATSMNECEDINQVYYLFNYSINQLLGNSCIITFDMMDNAKTFATGIEGIKIWTERISEITGIKFDNSKITFAGGNSGILDLLDNGKLHKIDKVNDEPQKEMATGNLKQDSDSSGDLRIYTIGFGKVGRVFGGAFICCLYDVGTDDLNIIETVSNQVSLLLQRRLIERDLKASEARYRDLSRELEVKVEERTRDLEHSNYILKQELIERHRAENALRESEIRLKELNETKDKFFSIIAHDLKNPFTCMLGSTELLTEKVDNLSSVKIKELVQIIDDSAKSGYTILQNLLDWSRSQTGMIKLRPEELDLGALINENINSLNLMSAKKNINITTDVKQKTFIYADKNIVNAVLRNLIGNAIKFTHMAGKVNVGASVNGNEVTVSIRDNGIGIPGEIARDLFRIETRHSRPGTSMEQGTGLGLKICKEFVEMQGGKIWVESTDHKGSEFKFTLRSGDASKKRG